MKNWIATLLALCSAVPALAQSASISVWHNDPDGIVVPGQTLQITTTISWQVPGPNNALFALMGDVRATPNLGIASANLFPYGGASTTSVTINPGIASLGSVEGVHLENGDLLPMVSFGQLLPPPWTFRTGFDAIRFDWTAPSTPGTVHFGWEPSATLPQPLIISSISSPWVQPVPTSIVGTSLVVIPGPPACVAMVLGGAALATRRRR